MKPYLSLVFNKYNLNIDAFSCCILFDSLRLSAKFSRETATRRHNTFKIANCKQRSITQAVVVDARTVIVRAIRCKRSANSLHEQRVWRVTRGGQVRVETSMTVSTTVVATAFININGVFRRCKRRGGRTKRKIMPTVTSQHPIRAGGHLPAPFRERVCPAATLNHRLHQITHDFGNSASIRVTIEAHGLVLWDHAILSVLRKSDYVTRV